MALRVTQVITGQIMHIMQIIHKRSIFDPVAGKILKLNFGSKIKSLASFLCI